MKKIILISLIVLLSGSINIFAATINITNTSGNPAYDAAINDLEIQVNASGDLTFLGDNKEFATGMADATQFTTATSTFNSFQNYSLFAVSVGFGMGVIIPESNDVNKLEDKLRTEGDLSIGIANTVTLNLGINLGLFIDNLYANAVIGGMPETDVYEGLMMQQTVLGLGLNYKVIDSIGLLGGLAKWRGISLGSGFYYMHSKSTYSFETGEQTVTNGQTVKVNPLVEFKSDISIYKIPVEAVTSFQALYIFNFGFGLGADLVFGKSDFTIDATTDVIETTGNTKIGEAELIDADTETNPSMFKFKILASVGFNLGPVKIDVPVSYYPTDGLFTGLSLGFVW